MKKFDFVIQRQNFYQLESGEFEMEVDLIHHMIVKEAKRRMFETTYQNLAAAIHEVLMEVGIACGEEMKAPKENDCSNCDLAPQGEHCLDCKHYTPPEEG